jgi:SNF2 family DNA or RNA helicase
MGVVTRRSKEELRNYQVRGARFVLNKKYCALLLDMGLGKTIIVLTAIARLLRARRIDSVLIVAPLRVVQAVWRQEARIWDHTRGLKFSVVHGSHAKRIAALNAPAHVYLTNFENLKWLDNVYGKRKAWPFDMLVVDESSAFKKVNTVRFKIMRRRVRDFKRRIILTGTFTPNGLHEAWPQMYLVDRGYHLGLTYGDFKSRFFDKGGFKGYKLLAKDDTLEEITELTSPIVMRLDSADWLELPKLIEVPVWVELPDEARAVYEELEREMFIAFEETGTFVDNPHAAALRNRCAQICGGAIYAEHEQTAAKVWQPIHTAKTDALAELVDELQGEPPIVSFQFKHELARIRKQHPTFDVVSGTKESELLAIVNKWNKGRSDGIATHPASIGHGLNLQYGGRHFIWFTLTDSLEQYLQMLKRLHRSGQERSVINYILLARNTVDEVKYSDINMKNAEQGRVNNAYRDRTFQTYMRQKKTRVLTPDDDGVYS